MIRCQYIKPLVCFFAILGLASTTGIAFGQSSPTASMTIQVNQPGAVVSSNLFGIFFEEINFGGDGGLYAELIRNRSFASSSSPDYWTFVTQGSAAGGMNVDESQPLNTNNLRSLRLTMDSGVGSVGAANSGYWGIPLLAGTNYNLSLYVRATNGFTGAVSVQLESADGSTVYAQASFNHLTTNWRKFSTTLRSSGTDTNARLVVRIANVGTVWLDEVSLFPQDTYKDEPNGLRRDLADMLAALHPSFLRYPGGNFIESHNVTNAVRWKKTIGDVATRPGHLNDSWGYWSDDGYGLDEAFRECADMGMNMLYGINAGLCLGYNGDTNNTVPLDQMGPWVQDALDLIQYANGDTNTTWGAKRAANGHPAPYHLKYLEIGNENGGTYYNNRYALFYDAIKAKYPNIHLIVPNWGGIPTSRPVDIEDEHYYNSPSWFEQNAMKYDSYDRNGPKVFVGEYAVTSGYGTYGNLAAALGEAAFMTGMERNSDIVKMASYAPLFANVNGIQWHPDLIYFDNHRCFGTPSYYVQQMFSCNRGDTVLPTSISVPGTVTNLPHGAIGVGSWNTAVQYTNIVVTSNGVTLYQSDFANQGTNGWRVYRGNWSTSAGLYQQTANFLTDCRSTTGDTNWANYTITLRARKISGSEGFLILFNWTDDANWTWLNIGGWGNTLDGVEQSLNGTKTILGTRNNDNIATGQWYDIKIVLTGDRIRCYLDGNLIQDVTEQTTVSSGLFASSTYNRQDNQVIIKAVNPYGTPLDTTFNLTGVDSISPNANVIQLTSGSPLDENSLSSPTYVSPTTNMINNAGTNFTLTLPANSLSVLRLTAGAIDNYTNLELQIPSPITNGIRVASALWGEQSGNRVNLTANSNHAITYVSADTNVATVDIYGNVTGVGSGKTQIIARYDALGLTATQTVEVVSIPATLEHRYSFSETSGTNVADSVGGSSWDGTLPNGGTFGGGQLFLAATNQQYVLLPSGILSNYDAVTIDAWASFGTLPTYCFFYGFGNTNGSTGVDYIFCQPKNGRIAITPGDNTAEQNTQPWPSGNWSGLSNLHVTAVYDPPAGRLALYTNGVLVAVNNSVTVPMSDVNAVVNYIARSLYSGDSYFDVGLDEFRIYDGALSADEIAASQALGPDELLSNGNPSVSASLSSTSSGEKLTLAWPLASAGFTVECRTNLVLGGWSPVNVTPKISGNQWQVDLPKSGNEEYYRLRR